MRYDTKMNGVMCWQQLATMLDGTC